MKINSYREKPIANVHFLNSCALFLGSSKILVFAFRSISFLYDLWLITLFYLQHPLTMWINFFSVVPIICAVSVFTDSLSCFSSIRFHAVSLCYLSCPILDAVSLESGVLCCFPNFRLFALFCFRFFCAVSAVFFWYLHLQF